MIQTKKVKTTPVTTNRAGFVFKKINYQLFIASIVIVAIGFILMMGTENIYSFTKITLAPLVVVAGFALGFVAILYKPKNKTNQE
jgi:peptidoglycan/LPS O-acetylase OafA/YrhL